MTTAYVQLISLILASLALLMGAYLLIIGKRPWRGGESTEVAPRASSIGRYVVDMVTTLCTGIVTTRAFRSAPVSAGLGVPHCTST